ncbi:unnamed protein product [Colias eurytheme]|nr:unnamed protein product [Colias eurytheme]
MKTISVPKRSADRKEIRELFPFEEPLEVVLEDTALEDPEESISVKPSVSLDGAESAQAAITTKHHNTKHSTGLMKLIPERDGGESVTYRDRAVNVPSRASVQASRRTGSRARCERIRRRRRPSGSGSEGVPGAWGCVLHRGRGRRGGAAGGCARPGRPPDCPSYAHRRRQRAGPAAPLATRLATRQPRHASPPRSRYTYQRTRNRPMFYDSRLSQFSVCRRLQIFFCRI